MTRRTIQRWALTAAFLLGALALSLAFEPVRVQAQTYIDQLRRPKIINGRLTLPNVEQVSNDTDDMVDLVGVGGTDNTDLRIDLDGTRPVLSSPTDTSIEIAEALVIGGAITFPNSETIDNATDDMIEFQGAAGTDNTDLRLDLDGTHPILDSPTDARIDLAEDTIGLGATNGETLVMSADDTFDFTREDAGAVTLTCSDNDGTCALVVDPGGAASLQLGSADVTAINLLTDDTGDGTDVVLPNQSVGAAEVLNDTLNWAQFIDASTLDADTSVTMADGIEWTWTVTHTAGDAEALTINASQTDDANATDDFDAIQINLASESGDAGDTIEGIVLVCAEGVANTIFDAAIRIDNAETTAATLTDGILVTSSGVNAGVTDGIDVSDANITNGVNLGVNRLAGGNSDFLTVGAADATVSYTRDTTGSVTFTCADDDANALCIYDSGGTGAVQVGTGDTTSVTVTTDNTGDGSDFEIPAGAIESDEILNGTIVTADIAENGVAADNAAVMSDSFVACGQQANAGTIYGGPALSSLNGDGAEYAIAGAVCDALDNADEGTADLPLGFANTAFKIQGMLCEVSSSGANGVTLTLRSALAGITPAVTCTVPTGSTTCSTTVGSTTDVAAGATVAVRATNTEDLSLQDFWCKVFIAWK